MELFKIDQDVRECYIDILDTFESDYSYYEDYAYPYFMKENIAMVNDFNQQYKITNQVLDKNYIEDHNNAYFMINFEDIRSDCTHPLVILLLEHYSGLADCHSFNIFLAYHQPKWNYRTEIILKVFINDLDCKWPSRNVNELNYINNQVYPSFVETGFHKVIYNDLKLRPYFYKRLDMNEDYIVTHFDDVKWLLEAIDY